MTDSEDGGQSGHYSIDDVYRPFLDTLRKSENIPLQRLVAYQRRALTGVLVHARDDIPFYRDRLAPLFAGDGSIDWARWSDIPILTRDEVQQQGETLQSSNLAEMHGLSSTRASSGSTGKPIRSVGTSLARVADTCLEYLHHDWHGLDRSQRMAVIRYIDDADLSYPDGAHTEGWTELARQLGHRGDCVFLDSATPVHQQIEWLNRMKPAYIATSPTILRTLAEENAAGHRFDFTLLATLSYAEQLQAQVREQITDVFNVPVFDNYSATEIGIMALQCPANTHYHVAAPIILVEVLNEDRTPCREGETGRVIVTPFYNYAMPLIRYDIGDYAQVGAPCNCGRSWPVLSKIHGRARNMFRFPDGSKIWPIVHSNKVRRYVNFRQYQIAQVAPLEIEIRVVPSRDNAEDVVFDLEGLTAFARQALGQPVTVRVKTMTEIPRAADLKFEDYVCELPPESF